ncbi:MAG TPA: SDR family oxidoreductase [Sphingomicrobium sp.]|nr:SDR family oxidoreductase [Sphingomicrobium sp.]
MNSWLVTGSAGFIGSHLLEALLRFDQRVASVDDFSTGHRSNLEEVSRSVGARAWQRHRFVEGSIADPEVCREACRGADIVLHQAARGSVPRSIEDPLATHRANVDGFVNLLVAARDAGVRRFVYASSSSVYGDDETLPKREGAIGRPLSPYAASKQMNEIYAGVFARCYGMEIVGLRYFNVFGARQDPQGAYAAVIPRWVRAALTGEPVEINGDGETSRDFCYVANVVQANLRAAQTNNAQALGRVYNIAVGESTSLKTLLELICAALGRQAIQRLHRPFRAGDIRHSHADISLARDLLDYRPSHRLASGIREALPWYVNRFSTAATVA